jgi:hypothetical protein
MAGELKWGSGNWFGREPQGITRAELEMLELSRFYILVLSSSVIGAMQVKFFNLRIKFIFKK